jgi:2-iminobutanoate/2-iminopropanoate deaminase
LKNLEAVLEAAGSSLDKVLKVLIFVTDIKDVPVLNESYNTMFKEPRPVSSPSVLQVFFLPLLL